MSAVTSTSKALITGATSGIGEATARQLAKDGFEVLVHGRDAVRGSKVVEGIQAAGGKARFVAADLGTSEGVAQLVKEAGDIDVLVNNAGISWFGPTETLAPDTFDALFASNVRGPYYLVAAFAPAMAKKGRGSIINIGSVAGSIGLAGGAAYSATKAAVASLTRSWVAEYSGAGVRINTIAPGPVVTPIAPPERIQALGETTPLKRAGKPQEIADAVSFLASPRASYITGAVIAVDGGRAAI